MNTHIVLLRGVMPIGKNRVPMAKLRNVLQDAGYGNVRTYIASGNALVDTKEKPSQIERRVRELIKKHIGPDLVVVVRTAKELAAVAKKNPFRNATPSRVGVTFFSKPLPKNFMSGVVNNGPEKVAMAKREIYVSYPDGMGRTTLKFPKMAYEEGTVRNMNTVTKLVAMSTKARV